MSLLEVDHLRMYIRLRTRVVKAVDDVSFQVEQGETVGLVGESGCGKTMAASSIMRLLPHGGHIVGGSVRLGGRDLTAMSDAEIRSVRGNEIGMIFQDPMTSLNPTMNIGRQIAESVVLHRGASKEQGLDRAAEVLGLVGVPNPRRTSGRLPAPALGRSPPAGHDRHGPGLRAEAADRRRAHHLPRRHHPGSDPGPARRLEKRAWAWRCC